MDVLIMCGSCLYFYNVIREINYELKKTQLMFAYHD